MSVGPPLDGTPMASTAMLTTRSEGQVFSLFIFWPERYTSTVTAAFLSCAILSFSSTVLCVESCLLRWATFFSVTL